MRQKNILVEIMASKMGFTANSVLYEITFGHAEDYDAVIVGGCVRDIMMGETPKDFDIATNMPIHELEMVFDNVYDIGRSKDFGIVTVKVDGFDYEIAQFRIDVQCDGRHPDNIAIVDNLREDVLRRDFTINGIAANRDGEIIDYVGGVNDLKDGIIRAIGDPKKRFQEDFLRMIRACRFAARFGFVIHHNTMNAIREYAHNIVHISPERIRDELFKVAGYGGEALALFISLLDEAGLLVHILPEVCELKKFREEKKWHPEAYVFGDGATFYHTLAAVRKSQSKDALVNICVLLHDIGKAFTHSYENGMHRFCNHDNVGAQKAEEIANRLRFSHTEKEAVVFCAKQHMKMTHVREMKKAKIFELVTHKYWKYLKEVVVCDDSSRLEAFDAYALESVLALAEDIAETFTPHTNNSTKLIDGRVVMEILGIPPGPKVGEVINKVTETLLESDEFVCIRKLIREHK